MTPGDRVAQLYPQALGTHFSRLLRQHGLQWDCSLIPVTTREASDFIVKFSSTVMYMQFNDALSVT
jgi:hypothetical protein